MSGILYGELSVRTVHLCIDMQNLLGRDSPWHAPWAARILPAIMRLAEPHAEQTIFTRFVPPCDIAALPGTWQRYYARWSVLTRERIDPGLIELLPPLAGLVPPAVVIDKPVYSPFSGTRLAELMRSRRTEALVISGAETDVCVLATVLAAVDRGFRVVVASDALCGSNDATHDALLTFYRERLHHQVETAEVEEILAAWQR